MNRTKSSSELKAMLDHAALEERKACAKICLDYKARLANISYSDWPSGHTAAEDCMDEINERSKLRLTGRRKRPAEAI